MILVFFIAPRKKQKKQYVAMIGMPEPQANHALIMARFAWECLCQVGIITCQFERLMVGPDTSNLIPAT